MVLSIQTRRLLSEQHNQEEKEQELRFIMEYNIDDALECFLVDPNVTYCQNIIETWTKLEANKRKMSIETIMTKVLACLGYQQTFTLLQKIPKERGTFSPRSVSFS